MPDLSDQTELTFSVSDEDYESLEKCAEEWGCSVGTLVYAFAVRQLVEFHYDIASEATPNWTS